MNKKVVIWGHKLHSHTHSYIHYAYNKAFTSMGYDVLWLDNVPNQKIPDGAFVMTEGQVDSHIPLNKTCSYLLHNCDTEKYDNTNINYKILQVYSHDVLSRPVEKIQECQYYQSDKKTLYQPWATDLLPHEIDEMTIVDSNSTLSPACHWVGSIMHGEHGNYDELKRFAEAAHESGVQFAVSTGVNHAEGMQLIRESYLAPAIQGSWQVKNGYIPCRIFKNISYGHMGSTNSDAVYNLLEGKVTYHKDCRELFFRSANDFSSISRKQREEAMNLIKEKHTYINRVHSIMEIM
jgi:hypothetical protein